jgi:hypothetical protein
MTPGQLVPIASEYRFRFRPDLRILATNENRPPRKGEWYISGSIPEGYLAPATLDYPYTIGRLVRVVVRTTEMVVEHLGKD